jgi:peptidoglycan/xylan/chitin deacetylase (PgdA/CDA1 family)
VFTLHGIADYSAPSQWQPLRRQMDKADLREVLSALKRKFTIVTMDEVGKILTGSMPAPDCAVALTFDDGYRNNFTQALPVLEELEIPATFYVATGFVESRGTFWFDRLDYALQSVSGPALKYQVSDKEFIFASGSRAEIQKEYEKFRQYCKENLADEEEFLAVLRELIDRLERHSGQSLESIVESDPWAAIVTKQELREYSGHPLVTIGSHTVNHIRLGCASDDVVARELADSKAQLEDWTGRRVDHFAFPNGEYDDRTRRAVRDAGYLTAATSDPGMNAAGHDSTRISRLSIPVDASPAEILARASGLEMALSAVVRRLTFRG